MRVGKRWRKKYAYHYSVLFFLMIAFRTNSPRAQTFLKLFYEHFIRTRKYDKNILIDEAELLFML